MSSVINEPKQILEQELKQVESFLNHPVNLAALKAIDVRKGQYVTAILEIPVTDFSSFLRREQQIGALRALGFLKEVQQSEVERIKEEIQNL